MVNDTFVCRHGCVVYTCVHMCAVVAACGDKRLALGHLPQLLLHFIFGTVPLTGPGLLFSVGTELVI